MQWIKSLPKTWDLEILLNLEANVPGISFTEEYEYNQPAPDKIMMICVYFLQPRKLVKLECLLQSRPARVTMPDKKCTGGRGGRRPSLWACGASSWYIRSGVRLGEDEEEFFCNRAKLYHWCSIREWKERGIGNVKILRHKPPVNRLPARRSRC